MARVITQFEEVQQTCTRCKSKIAFEFKDATYDDAFGKVHVTCPVCKARLTLDPLHIPNEWMQAFPE